MVLVAEVAWTGGTPGYGDAVQAGWRICEPNAAKMHYSDGRVLVMPEAAHAVAISEGLQLAWEGANTGLLYREMVSTGATTDGDHSFLWVGEELHPFTADAAGKAIYQATAGGWRYVDDAGNLVPFGPTYSGPPLWNFIAHGNVTIGQGPNDGDGLCVTVDGGPVRQFVPGNWNDIKFRRYGDVCVVLAVEYSQHLTRVWHVTVEELSAMPVLAAPPPPPPPPPVPALPGPVQAPLSTLPPVIVTPPKPPAPVVVVPAPKPAPSHVEESMPNPTDAVTYDQFTQLLAQVVAGQHRNAADHGAGALDAYRLIAEGTPVAAAAAGNSAPTQTPAPNVGYDAIANVLVPMFVGLRQAAKKGSGYHDLAEDVFRYFGQEKWTLAAMAKDICGTDPSPLF